LRFDHKTFMIIHMRRRGFTIIELVIVIAIMAILMTLGMVNLRSSQANARDTQRRVDIASIAQHLETYYTSGTDFSVFSQCTGGTVTYNGLYTVITFTSSGTLTCSTGTITASVLVVGGGGGGGASGAADNRGGGGGGGSVVYTASTVLASGATSVIVGGGGAYSNAGSSSTFASTTAAGGGAGGNGGAVGGAGGNGGGGGASASAGNYAGGTGSQGYNGGQGGTDSLTYREGGGGGGAGGIGFDASASGLGGIGGVGYASSISGTSTYYGGGGGGGGVGASGGLGGSGQGGAGASTTPGTPGYSGTPNTGGGGGGSGGGATTAGAGGSGIVIIRYLTPVTTNTYPSTAITTSDSTMTSALRDIDVNNLIAPGMTDPMQTFIAATNNVQTTAGVLPQPTINQYVYQPLHTDGSLCNDNAECSKFNLYFRTEVDNNVNMVTSVDQ